MENSTRRTTRRFNLKFYYLLISLFLSLPGISQNVGINPNGAPPNASAGLDVDFPDKGILIPRVALTGSANFAPLAAHVAGMVVYNTATISDITPGFYYNDGTKWIAGFPAGNTLGDMLYWNGSAWVVLPAGTPGQILQFSSANIPAWIGSAFMNLTTTAASAIAATTATTGGTIVNTNGTTILSRGVCYATTTGPTTGSSIVAGTAVSPFVCNLSGLVAGTIYYVRSYAVNNSVTSYGNEINFSTIPTLTTTAATLITSNSARTGGTVTTGNAPVIERGIVYGLTTNPTTANTKVIDPAPGAGLFVADMTGLAENTLYYARSYAINAGGTAYGAQITITTLSTLTTKDITSTTQTTASSGGTIAVGGNASITARGVCWSTSTGPTTTLTTKTSDLSGTGVFTSSITGLSGGTTYYVRAYSTNAGGTSYGNELTFSTLAPIAPTITSTTTITNITSTSATSGGVITSDGGSPITAKGVCWSTSPTPVLGVGNFTSNGTGTASFVSSISGLTGGTTYYVRAYATNSVDTGYGPVDVSFSTCNTPIYTIGQSVGGGYVVYVDCTGQHGLIAATVDQGTAVWGCSTVLVGTSATYGAGPTNTASILAKCATRPICASLASTYTGGGFTDWYLPSTAELTLMMNQHTLLGFGSGVTYATSSENSTNNVTALYWNGSTVISSAAVKTYAIMVRAVRSF